MTSHELAKKLLDMPDLPVVVFNACEESWMAVRSIEQALPEHGYWNGTDWRTEPHILLE